MCPYLAIFQQFSCIKYKKVHIYKHEEKGKGKEKEIWDGVVVHEYCTIFLGGP